MYICGLSIEEQVISIDIGKSIPSWCRYFSKAVRWSARNSASRGRLVYHVICLFSVKQQRVGNGTCTKAIKVDSCLDKVVQLQTAYIKI
jgi:hypothetical protein